MSGDILTGSGRPIRAVHDHAKTARAHTIGGSAAQHELRRGRGAHVFDDGIDLDLLEMRVWTDGQWVGPVSGPKQRADWDRFIWRSPTPIGRRVQRGKPDLLLRWVEIKGKVNQAGEWVYHLVPRPRPAQ